MVGRVIGSPVDKLVEPGPVLWHHELADFRQQRVLEQRGTTSKGSQNPLWNTSPYNLKTISSQGLHVKGWYKGDLCGLAGG